MAEDCTGPPEDAEQTLAEDEERSEDLNSDDDQCISNMRKALHQSTPGSLRHRQITSMLQTCLREREEQCARDKLHYQSRPDRLVARGVPRAHADLPPKNASDPLPIILKSDLDVLRQKTIEEEMETRKLKARQAFKGRWLREMEKELYKCRKSPPNSRPSFQGKPGGLRRCTVQQVQAPPSVTWNLQHSRGVRGTEEGGRRPRNSPPARPALRKMCPRTIADAIGASMRRSVHRNGAE